MIIQFRTADNSIWFLDLEQLYWARIDKPADDPESTTLESGDLTNLNYGRFALAPRTPKTPGPGNGLSNIMVMPLVHGTQVIITLQANVPIKEFTMPIPIKEVKYEIVGAKATDEAAVAAADDVQTDTAAIEAVFEQLTPSVDSGEAA